MLIVYAVCPEYFIVLYSCPWAFQGSFCYVSCTHFNSSTHTPNLNGCHSIQICSDCFQFLKIGAADQLKLLDGTQLNCLTTNILIMRASQLLVQMCEAKKRHHFSRFRDMFIKSSFYAGSSQVKMDESFESHPSKQKCA